MRVTAAAQSRYMSDAKKTKDLLPRRGYTQSEFELGSYKVGEGVDKHQVSSNRASCPQAEIEDVCESRGSRVSGDAKSRDFGGEARIGLSGVV